jgi:hypothetical protein
MVEDFQARDQPVVSVDTKKKELVGNFKNGGREWASFMVSATGWSGRPWQFRLGQGVRNAENLQCTAWRICMHV